MSCSERLKTSFGDVEWNCEIMGMVFIKNF